MTRRILKYAESITLTLVSLLTGCAQVANYAPVQTVNQAFKPVTGNEENSPPIKPKSEPQALHLPAAKPPITNWQSGRPQVADINAKTDQVDTKTNNHSKSQVRSKMNKVVNSQTPAAGSSTQANHANKRAVSTLTQKPGTKIIPQAASLSAQYGSGNRSSLPLTVESKKGSKNHNISPDKGGTPRQKSSVREQKKLAKVSSNSNNIGEEKSIISIDNKKMLKLNFDWPLLGKISKNFSQTGRKGIDISGKNGQAVHAAESGKAVYCGQGLKGFGNLAIIKHNETYLSAYAHNRVLYIKEGQKITKGQKIGQVGESGPQKASLYFEIRKNGKPINPLSLLPGN